MNCVLTLNVQQQHKLSCLDPDTLICLLATCHTQSSWCSWSKIKCWFRMNVSSDDFRRHHLTWAEDVKQKCLWTSELKHSNIQSDDVETRLGWAWGLFSPCVSIMFLSSSLQSKRLYEIRKQRDKMIKEGTYTPPACHSGKADQAPWTNTRLLAVLFLFIVHTISLFPVRLSSFANKCYHLFLSSCHLFFSLQSKTMLMSLSDFIQQIKFNVKTWQMLVNHVTSLVQPWWSWSDFCYCAWN